MPEDVKETIFKAYVPKKKYRKQIFEEYVQSLDSQNEEDQLKLNIQLKLKKAQELLEKQTDNFIEEQEKFQSHLHDNPYENLAANSPVNLTEHKTVLEPTNQTTALENQTHMTAYLMSEGEKLRLKQNLQKIISLELHHDRELEEQEPHQNQK